MAASKVYDRAGGNTLPLIGTAGHEVDTNIPIKSTIVKKRKGPNVPPKGSRLKKDRRESVVIEAFSKSKLDELTVVSGLTKQLSVTEINEKDNQPYEYSELLFAVDGKVDSKDMLTITSLGERVSMEANQWRRRSKDNDGDDSNCIDPSLVQWNDFTDKERLEENMNSLITCKKVILEIQVAKLDYIPGIIALPVFHCIRCWESWNKNKQIQEDCDEELSPFRGLPMALDETSASLLLLNNEHSANISFIQVRGRKRSSTTVNGRRGTLHAAFNSRSSIGLDGHSSQNVGDDGRRRYGGIDVSYSSYSSSEIHGDDSFSGDDDFDFDNITGQRRNRHGKDGDVERGADGTLLSKHGSPPYGSASNSGLTSLHDGRGPNSDIASRDGQRSLKDEILDDLKHSRIIGESSGNPHDEKASSGVTRGDYRSGFPSVSGDGSSNLMGGEIDANGRRKLNTISHSDEKGKDGELNFPTGARHGELPSLSQRQSADTNGNQVIEANMNRNLEAIVEDSEGMSKDMHQMSGLNNNEGGIEHPSILGNSTIDSKLFSKVQVHDSLLGGNNPRNSISGEANPNGSNGKQSDNPNDKNKNINKNGDSKTGPNRSNNELPELNNKKVSSSRMSGPTSSSNNWLTGARVDDKGPRRASQGPRTLKGEDRRNSRRASNMGNRDNNNPLSPVNNGSDNFNPMKLDTGEQRQQQPQQYLPNGEIAPDGVDNFGNMNRDPRGNGGRLRTLRGDDLSSNNSIESFRSPNRTSLPPIEKSKIRSTGVNDENYNIAMRNNRMPDNARFNPGNVSNMFGSPGMNNNRRGSENLRWDQSNNQFYNNNDNSPTSTSNNNNLEISNMFGAVSPRLKTPNDRLKPASVRDFYTPSPPIPTQVSTNEYMCLSLMNFTSSYTYSFYELPPQYRLKEGSNVGIRSKPKKKKR